MPKQLRSILLVVSGTGLAISAAIYLFAQGRVTEIGRAGFGICLALLGITLMVAGNIPGRTQTLPLAIYDRVQANAMGEANALALIAVGGVAVLLFGLSRMARLKY